MTMGLWLIGPTVEKASEPKPQELFNIHSVMWQICSCLGNRIPFGRIANLSIGPLARNRHMHQSCYTHTQPSLDFLCWFRPLARIYFNYRWHRKKPNSYDKLMMWLKWLPANDLRFEQNVLHCKIVESKLSLVSPRRACECTKQNSSRTNETTNMGWPIWWLHCQFGHIQACSYGRCDFTRENCKTPTYLQPAAQRLFAELCVQFGSAEQTSHPVKTHY